MNQIDRDFIKFHQNNSHVYQLIIKYTKQVWSSGHRTFGMGAIFERIRWDYAVSTNAKPFKLNNNYRSRYVKLMERDFPNLKGFFRSRDINPSSLFAIDYKDNPDKHLWP